MHLKIDNPMFKGGSPKSEQIGKGAVAKTLSIFFCIHLKVEL